VSARIEAIAHRQELVRVGTAPAGGHGSELTVERPDWVKCALTGRNVVPKEGWPVAEQKTWCDRTPPDHEWCFTDASHAALNGANGGRMVLCPACCTAIVRALWTGVSQ
jgi:hypothetical protein